jgi:MFS family permease
MPLRSLRTLPRAARLIIVSDALIWLSLMAGFVVLPWWVAREGGVGDLALWSIVRAAVGLVAMPLLSPLADREHGRRLIVAALVIYTVAAVAMAALASAGAYHFWTLITLRAISVAALAVVHPAMNRLMIDAAPSGRLTDLLSAQQGVQSVGRLIGPALGGAMLLVGIAAALWLHAMLLVVATLLALRLPADAAAPAHAQAAQARWWPDLVVGLRAIWRVPLERHWNLVNFVSWLFLFPALTMLLPLRLQALEVPGLWLGLCEAGAAVGTIVGAFGISRWSIDRYGRYATRVLFALLQGFALAAVGLVAQPVALVALFALSGLSTSAMSLVGLTHRSLARPETLRGRMFAGSMAVTNLAAALGPAVAGAALIHWDVAWVYVAFGALGGLTSLALMAVPGFRAFMRASESEAEGWYARHHPEAFGDAPARVPPAREP